MKIFLCHIIILIFYFNNFSQVRESINVKTGWNLIGSLSTGSISSIISTVPANIISSPFYKFNNQTKSYESVSIVEAGKSYWVEFSQNGKLYFNRPKQSSIEKINN